MTLAVQPRIIPRLDVKGPNLVKGIHLEGLRVLGKPERFARAYYEAGADELMFVDVVASLYGRNNLLELVSRTAREIFVPMTVGGGVRSTDDIREILRAGADKVSVNTAAVNEPDLVRRAANLFGASTIVVSIEAIRRQDGRYEACTDNGRELTGLDAIEWARRAAELGAGELVVTSIDREGTGRGYDVELSSAVAWNAVAIPIIACGGAGKPSDAVDALRAGASAVAMASVLHYGELHRDPVVEAGAYAREINLAHLAAPGFGRITAGTISDVRRGLADAGYRMRPVRHREQDSDFRSEVESR